MLLFAAHRPFMLLSAAGRICFDGGRQERSTVSENRPYRWLAEYYDRIFFGTRGPLDAARAHVLGPVLPRVRTACDLACGTGTTAIDLAKLGIRMTGLDRSAGMCSATRGKAAKAGVPLRVRRADMRRFTLPAPVDLILCEGDALNHVSSKSDLPQVLECVINALLPGGYFYFDVNNRLGFEKYWGLTNWIEAPGVAVVMHGDYDAPADRAWMEVEWFIRHEHCWRRHRERIKEVCWSSAEMRAALDRAGFQSVRAWDASRFFGHGSVVTKGCRTVWLARKA